MGFMTRIMIIGAVIYLFVLPVLFNGYSSVMSLFWWMRPWDRRSRL